MSETEDTVVQTLHEGRWMDYSRTTRALAEQGIKRGIKSAVSGKPLVLRGVDWISGKVVIESNEDTPYEAPVNSISFGGVDYLRIKTDGELVLVRDPVLGEYGIYDGATVLIYDSRREAEAEMEQS